MKRFLTTGFFCAILGIVIGGAPADASLISRSFLDQALTDYATTTALDLKANQSDFTDLSDKIGTLPEGITLENFYKGWVDSGGESMAKYIATQGGKGMVYTYDPFDPLNDYFKPERFPDVGYLDVLASLIDKEGFTPAENSVLAPFWYLTKQALRVGEIPHGKTVAGMIDEINTKIGTLPSGKFPSMPGHVFLFALNQPLTYPTSLAELINAIYGNSETGARGLLDAIVMGIGRDPDGDGQKEPGAGLVPNFDLAKNANNLASANATKIGTLPTEYATVGAALTAMKSDIDAKSLPSTSADGQYVLTAKKVGETISYTWVKMDLTNEEQSQ